MTAIAFLFLLDTSYVVSRAVRSPGCKAAEVDKSSNRK